MRLGAHLAIAASTCVFWLSACGSAPRDQLTAAPEVRELPVATTDAVSSGVGRLTVDLSPLEDIPGTVELELRAEDDLVGTLSVTADFRVATKLGTLLDSGDCTLPTSARIVSFTPGPVPLLDVPTVESYDIPPEWDAYVDRVMMTVRYENVSQRSRFTSVFRRNGAGDEFGNLLEVPAGEVEWSMGFDLDESFGPPDILYQYYNVSGSFCGEGLTRQ
jgi:hypothetical protein